MWWGKEKNVYLNEAFIHLRKHGGNQVENPICRAVSTTIVITPENKLVLPNYHLGTEDFKIKGNLFDLYKSKEVQEIVALEGKHKECEGRIINY